MQKASSISLAACYWPQLSNFLLLMVLPLAIGSTSVVDLVEVPREAPNASLGANHAGTCEGLAANLYNVQICKVLQRILYL
jgi:hypothetical protein